MNSSVKKQTISGLIWSTLQRFGTLGIGFVSNIILARLLDPYDYGCIGLLAIFIAISNTFIDGGFGSALIQKEKPTKEDYSTIFFWNLALSFALYTLLFIAAPYIAEFYEIPLLCKILRVQSVILIINSFSLIQANILRKQLKFKTLATLGVTATIISEVV